MNGFVVRCGNCWRWQVCEINKLVKYVFVCRRCGKNKKLWHVGSGYTLLVSGPFSLLRASSVCSVLNGRDKSVKVSKAVS